jgi:transcription elongation factor Elf1
MLEPAEITCPYCGETFETTVDCSGGDQRYIEDCQVCCRPVEFSIETGTDGELLSVQVRRDDD